MTAPWRGLAARCRSALGGLLGRSDAERAHPSGWVEPGNAITRAIYASLGDLDELAQALQQPWEQARELAPDNVLIATSAPRPEGAMAATLDAATVDRPEAEPKQQRDGTAA